MVQQTVIGRGWACRQAAPARRRAARSLLLALALLAPWALLQAQPAPVLAGAWDVQSLLVVDPPAVQPVGTALPRPQSRRYRICIGPERARSPMLPRQLPPGTELVFEGQSLTGSYDEPGSSPRRQVDFAYRRLSATAFEGTHDLSSLGRVHRLQYFAQHAGPNCGAQRPTWPQDNGDP